MTHTSMFHTNMPIGAKHIHERICAQPSVFAWPHANTHICRSKYYYGKQPLCAILFYVQKHREHCCRPHDNNYAENRDNTHPLTSNKHTRTFLNCRSPPSYPVFTRLFFYLDLNCQIDHSEG